MKTDQILHLDFRKPENQAIIQKALKKIKPFSDLKEEPTLRHFEKFISLVVHKYDITPQYIMYGQDEERNLILRISLKTKLKSEWIKTISGSCLYEVYSKAVIFIYSEIKKGNIGKLND